MKKYYNRWLLKVVRNLKNAPVLVIAVLLVAGSVSVGVVHASIQSQIDALNAKDTQALGNLNDLQLQAKNYQDAIHKLEAEINAVQAAINASEAKQAQLQTQINLNQLKLNQQKKVLGEDLKSMYVGGQMTTVEMLATSKNLSDFVDAETYGSAVQNKIQNTLNQITALQNELRAQQSQVQQLLATQQTPAGSLVQ